MNAAAANDLRKQSTRELSSLKLLIPGHLPPMERSLQVRPASEIQSRMFAIHAVAAAAHGFDHSKALSWATSTGASRWLTTDEEQVLRGTGPVYSPHWKSQVHSEYALAWVLGLIEVRSWFAKVPNTFVNVMPDLLKLESTERVESEVLMRSDVEILAAVDLHHCLHWAIREHGSTVVDNCGLSVHDVEMRRRALEWTCSQQDWDDISLDT